MSWEYCLVGAGVVVLLGGGFVFAMAIIYAVFIKGRVRPAVAKAQSVIAEAVTPMRAVQPNLAGAMEDIDVQAKARAYDKVSDKLVTHRAGRYEAELLDALAPKSETAAKA